MLVSLVAVAELVAAAAAAEVEVGAADAVVNGSSSSLGHGSPGSNMNVESLASCFCASKDVVALGLITPTIW